MYRSKSKTCELRHPGWLNPLLMLLLLTALVSVAAAADKTYPGELYDIGTHRLHMHCMGEGSPTIVIDSGAGGFSLEWINIQNNLAEHTRICSYDRAGYGFSDPGPLPRTSAQITFELRKLLDAANVAGPYVLVGHSFGGYNIRYFASLYPDEVVGMVLVDASHPEQFNTEEFKHVKLGTDNKEPKPMHKRVRMIRPVIAPNFPEQNRMQAYMLMMSMKSRMTVIDELDNMEYSARQIMQHEEFKAFEFPLVIITRGKRVWPNTEMGDRREQQWTWLQNDLENISTQSYHFIARNSGHIVHLDEPELVSSNILFALDRARTYDNEQQLIEKFDIRLAHYGTIQYPLSVNYYKPASANNDFFVMEQDYQQVLFNTEMSHIQALTDSLPY